MKPTRELRKAIHRSGKLIDRLSRSRSSGSRWALVAGALAATAAVVAYRARKAEREHPPTGRFVEIDGVTLHYTERGEGPPVVLLHGNGAMASDFEGSGLIDLLADRHRVIAFDRRGFGYSERPRSRVWTARAQAALISRTLSALDVRQPIVVAPSWGTLVALNLAREISGKRERPRARVGLLLSDITRRRVPAISAGYPAARGHHALHNIAYRKQADRPAAHAPDVRSARDLRTLPRGGAAAAHAQAKPIAGSRGGKRIDAMGRSRTEKKLPVAATSSCHHRR